MRRNSMMRAGAALFLSLLTALPVGGAGASSNAVHNMTSLTVAVVGGEDANLSPLTSRERDLHSLMALSYEGLVSLDDSERPTPCLAEEWTAPGDNSKRWVFRLRSGVTFHNGKPLTSADVIATLDYILALGQYDEKRGSDLPREERGVYANLMEAYVTSWKALDEMTVQITASRPYYGFLNAMTFPILPAEEVGNPLPSGTGPYRIAQYEPGDRMWLSAWQGWWNPIPNVQNIVATIYPNTERALEAFDAGQADVTMTRSLTATRYTGSLRSFSLPYATRQLETLMMHHNEKKGILRDETVRRAIISAIDRTALVRQIYQGMATPASTPIMPGTWLYDMSAMEEGYDPATARALLEDAGWTLNINGIRERFVNGAPTLLQLNILTYEEPSGGVRQSTANAIADMLRQVGIETTVTVSSYGRVKERLEAGSFELALCGMNLDVVPDPGFMLLRIDSNYSRCGTDTMIELIKNMRSQASEAGYKRAVSELQHQFASEAPFMCLFFRNGALLTRDTFSNVSVLRELELFRGVESW